MNVGEEKEENVDEGWKPEMRNKDEVSAFSLSTSILVCLHPPPRAPFFIAHYYDDIYVSTLTACAQHLLLMNMISEIGQHGYTLTIIFHLHIIKSYM